MLRNISKRYFAEEFELDESDVDELIEEALTTLVNGIERLEQRFAQASDVAELKEVAHALKGNLLNMGLSEQAQKALDMEEELSHDLDRAHQYFLTLKKELESF